VSVALYVRDLVFALSLNAIAGKGDRNSWKREAALDRCSVSEGHAQAVLDAFSDL
jgi:hypothetical protein